MPDCGDRPLLSSLRRIAVGTACGLGLLALLFWPGECAVCRNRGRANEAAAIATLRNVHAAQVRFRAGAAIDRDRDGRGEFGWFGDLAGPVPRPDGPPVPLLSPAFAAVQGGRVARSGYLFQLWLPARGGGWTTDGGAGEVDPAAAGAAFRCVAWPNTHPSKRAFFVDEGGVVHACGNEDRRYAGAARPLLGAAAVATAPAIAAAVASAPRGPGDWHPVP